MTSASRVYQKDGDYLLTVSTGDRDNERDEYDLTIGAVGPQGPQGPAGPPGSFSTYVRTGLAGPTVPPFGGSSATVLCDEGDLVLSGGGAGGTSGGPITASRPYGTTGWTIKVQFLSEDAFVEALCADFSP